MVLNWMPPISALHALTIGSQSRTQPVSYVALLLKTRIIMFNSSYPALSRNRYKLTLWVIPTYQFLFQPSASMKAISSKVIAGFVVRVSV